MKQRLEAVLAAPSLGVFEAIFQLLAEISKTAHVVQMFDSTVMRSHVSAAAAKAGSKITPSATHGGSPSCKIHLTTDFDVLPIAFLLTRRRGQRLHPA